MSDAMSSVEIEDVLSSIRRLVSEDHRPAARQAPVLVDDKLILTPALRVVAMDGNAVPAQGARPEAHPSTQTAAEPPLRGPLPRLHLGSEPVIEELVASLEQAVEAQGLEWESETGDPMPQTVAFEWTAGGWAAQTAEPVDAEIVEPAEAEIIAEAPLLEPQAETTETPSWAQDDPGELFADLAPLLTTPDPPEAEPDPVWVDQAEAEVVATLDQAAPQAEHDLAEDSAPEMTFDESVLRDLVRDLIREELQGGLGERITRNVRKLVRAEIARALATRDLD